jgi:hypothetical protein
MSGLGTHLLHDPGAKWQRSLLGRNAAAKYQAGM